MAKFPSYTTVGYTSPLKVSIIFKNLKSNFDDLGSEKRRRKWLFPKRNITLVYDYITSAKAKIIWDFYKARYGSYEAFNFFFKDEDSYTDEYVGTGDGSTTGFDMPGKETSARSLYVDEELYSEAADATSEGDYYIVSEGGADGADNIQFNSIPPIGGRITVDFTGLLKVRCRFKEDNLDYTQIVLRLTTIGITLKGLLNDE